jgi:hypothetical protein
MNLVYTISDSKAAQDYLMATSPPSWTDSDVDTIMLDSMNSSEVQGTSSISILSSSLRRSTDMENRMELDLGKSFYQTCILSSILSHRIWDGSSRLEAKKKARRSRWHLGIRSPSRPEDVMNEVYRALKVLNMDWKAYGRYHVCCRDKIGEHVIKINLQLYKVDQRYYLLDFRNVKENGELSVFDFLHSCNRIIMELAANSPNEK